MIGIQTQGNTRRLKKSEIPVNLSQLPRLSSQSVPTIRKPKVEKSRKTTNVQQFQKRKATNEELEGDLQDKPLTEATDNSLKEAMRVQFHLQVQA